MKTRWKQGLAAALVSALLLSMPGGMELASAAADASWKLYAAANTISYTPEGANYTLEFNDGTITGSQFTADFDGTLVLPESIDGQAVTAIGQDAFYNKDNLYSITIPTSITSVGQRAFSSCDNLSVVTGGAGLLTIGSSAFESCWNLSEVPEFSQLTTLGSYAFKNTALTSFVVPAGVTIIYAETFRSISELTTVTFKGDVTEIQGYAFADTGLQKLYLPASVKTLGKNAFSSCRSLTEVQLFDGITTIPEGAFGDCSALTSIILPDSVETIEFQAFSYCTALEEIVLPQRLTTLKSRAFASSSSLKAISLPEGITVIESETFAGCSALERVTIPSTVEEIQDWAFFQCSALDDVVLPTGLKVLGRNAFMQCSSLSQIVVPSGIETMGNSVFSGCTSLTSVTLSEGLTMLTDSMFSGCTALKQITLPHTVSSIPGSLFYRCRSLEAIEIPDNIISIGSSAFYECSSLRSATIYGVDVDIDYSAFSYNPSDLVIYCYQGSTAEQYAKDHNIQFEYIGVQAETYTLTAEVLDPDGQAVTDGFTVNWYREDGTTSVGTGVALSGAQTGENYVCEVLLDEALSQQYETPQTQRFTVGESDATITFQLIAKVQIPQITVTGQVTDQEGTPLSGASIVVTALTGETLASAQSNGDGQFTLTDIPAHTARLRITLDGYYSKTLSLPLEEAAETGSYTVAPVTLYKTVSDRITLTVTRQYAAAAGETPRTEVLPSLGGLTVSLSSSTLR